tara:strand:- start:64 stop:516 length:453 start_codon:yes stop_codon:yes gene_type:complete
MSSISILIVSFQLNAFSSHSKPLNWQIKEVLEFNDGSGRFLIIEQPENQNQKARYRFTIVNGEQVERIGVNYYDFWETYYEWNLVGQGFLELHVRDASSGKQDFFYQGPMTRWQRVALRTFRSSSKKNQIIDFYRSRISAGSACKNLMME